MAASDNRYITANNINAWLENNQLYKTYLPKDSRLVTTNYARALSKDIYVKNYSNSDKYITESEFIFPYVYFTGKYTSGSTSLHATSYVWGYKGNKGGGNGVGVLPFEFGYLTYNNTNYTIDNSNFFLSSTWKSDSIADTISTGAIYHNGSTHQIVITSNGVNNTSSCVYTYAFFGLKMPDNTTINRLLTLIIAKYPSGVNPPVAEDPYVYIQVNVKNNLNNGIYAVCIELTEYNGSYPTNNGVFDGGNTNYSASSGSSPIGTPLIQAKYTNPVDITHIYFNKNLFNEVRTKIGVQSITVVLYDGGVQGRAYQWIYSLNGGAFDTNYYNSHASELKFYFGSTDNNSNRFYTGPATGADGQLASDTAILNIIIENNWPQI